jgi:hypothetical protein
MDKIIEMASTEIEAANDVFFKHPEKHDQQNRTYSLLAEITDSYINQTQTQFYRLDDHLENAINEFCRLADSANNAPGGTYENIILREFGEREKMNYETLIKIIAYLNNHVRISE